MVMLTTPKQIDFARLATLKAGLKLEMVGMHRHGRSCYSILKEELNLKGSKKKVFDQVQAMVDKELGRVKT